MKCSIFENWKAVCMVKCADMTMQFYNADLLMAKFSQFLLLLRAHYTTQSNPAAL